MGDLPTYVSVAVAAARAQEKKLDNDMEEAIVTNATDRPTDSAAPRTAAKRRKEGRRSAFHHRKEGRRDTVEAAAAAAASTTTAGSPDDGIEVKERERGDHGGKVRGMPPKFDIA